MDVKKRLLCFALALFSTLFLVLVFFLWDHFTYQQAMHKVFSSFDWRQIVQSKLLMRLLYYFTLFFLLHMLLAVGLWALYHFTLGQRIKRQHTYFSLGVLFLLMAVEYLLLLNKIMYTRSLFSFYELGTGLLAQAARYYLLFYTALLVILISWLLLRLCGQIYVKRRHPVFLWTTIAVVVSASAFFPYLKPAPVSAQQPNVILIGVDSLRPDYVSTQGTPTIADFLEHAVTFTDTVTPQGRTYVSWVSLLSGMYPLQHGARFNLMPEQHLDKTIDWLPQQLRAQGYQTVFATDERRYSNIDESYGFDKVLGPEMGAIDFILSIYADLPLVNLVANTWLGQQLFPVLYANRAATTLYQPQHFSALLKAFLQQHRQPLFMVTHFCLPHWPYFWAAENDVPDLMEKTLLGQQRYQQAVAAADQQVAALLQHLEENQLLKNAIVVLISDHGENLPGEKTVFQYQDGEQHLEATFGHGSAVLSPNQNQVVMAWRRYGENPWAAAQSAQQASLIDIKPTLASLLQLPASSNPWALSLQPWLENPQQRLTSRAVFIETGFNVPAMQKSTVDVNSIAATGSKFYRLDKQGKVRLKEDYIHWLLAKKQRAIKSGQYLIGRLPDESGVANWLALDLQDKTAYPYRQIRTDPQLSALQQQLLSFYGDELTQSQKTSTFPPD